MRNRLGLPALFGIDAGVCARSIDERENGPAEFLCDFHDAKRLTIAFGFRHAEVAIQLLLRIASFLLADQTDGHVRQKTETAHDGGIVTKRAIAVNFDEVLTDVLDVIEEIGSLWMPRKLYLLVRRKVVHRHTKKDAPCPARKCVPRIPQ